VLTGGPGAYSNGLRRNLIQIQISNGFELYSNSFKLRPLKKDIPGIENFEIKYGYEGLE
jgi:hypothetical protein